MKNRDLTIICPSYNNLRHLKNLHESLKKYGNGVKVIYMDDGSDDGTWAWMNEVNEDEEFVFDIYRTQERLGHTILYDKGIEMAETEVVGIIHADMIITEGTFENALKHLEPGKVVCSTRVEPPLHTAQNEKYIRDFGLDFNSLDVEAFDKFAKRRSLLNQNRTTNGMFAPWILLKEDFNKTGGHDELFAPYPLEDSDLFQRWMLDGYEMIQSWDSFVYHLTSRGHRWNKEVGVDDDDYQYFSNRARYNWIRKWGTPFPMNNQFQLPKIHAHYEVILYCPFRFDNPEVLNMFEPGFHKIYVNADVDGYIEKYQSETLYNLNEIVNSVEEFDPDSIKDGQILVTFKDPEILNKKFGLMPYAVIAASIRQKIKTSPTDYENAGISVEFNGEPKNVNYKKIGRIS